MHKDYLGSVLAITDEAGKIVEQRHFDAWGSFTHLKIGNNAIITDKEQIRDYLSNGNLIVDRGYTSHEHFAEVGIIHMNGRLYDPLLRRFLNADENIQDPYNTQNYNKYGYVLNNPLMYNDPSGEFLAFLGVWAFWKAVIIGATVGLASYTLGLAVTGNITQWNIGGALKSTFFGAVGGATSFGIGSIFSVAGEAGRLTAFADNLKKSIGSLGLAVIQGGTHAISQGVLGLMQGGDFVSSAVAGFAGSLGASGWTGVIGTSGGAMIAFGALSGGIGAELTGGNFWQGALIGGVVAGLNHAMHSIKFESPKDIIILNASKEVYGAGHNGYIVEYNGKFIYIASDGLVDGYPVSELILGGKQESTIKAFNTKQEALDFAKSQYGYDNFLTIKTTPKQDRAFIRETLRLLQKDYHVKYNNCATIINNGLKDAGFNIPNQSFIPNKSFDAIKCYFKK